MAKDKVTLDTSVRAKFKDGSTKTYPSIEEAAKQTGVSVSSIKIRANKPGASGKDKITFEWLSSKTRLHYQAKKSRTKGSAFESEIIKNLVELGYTGCVRAASESKNADNNKIDIVDTLGELPINIQAKNTYNTPNYFEIRQACKDKSKPFVLCWKKAATGGEKSPGTVAILDINYFYELLKLARNDQ